MQVKKHTRDVLKRLLPPEEYQKALLELSVYHNQEGDVYGDPLIVSMATNSTISMPVYQWWGEYGTSPML